VIVGAVLIFGPFVVVELVADVFVELYREEHGGIPALLAITLVPVANATVGGGVIYAGALERIVGAHHYGAERHSALQLARGLPLKRLLIADLILMVVTITGYALFVVPGLVAFTFFCLVGPMITIEGRDVRSAFRRSAQLVRTQFLLVFGLVTLPVIVEEAIFHSLAEFALHHPRLITFLLDGISVAIVGAAIGLIEVALAYRLVHRDEAAYPILGESDADQEGPGASPPNLAARLRLNHPEGGGNGNT
jgi:hypothetical protein